MARKAEKWFSMRTEFFGPDSYQLGLFDISPRALSLYVGSIAYVARWNLDALHRSYAGMIIGPRPGAAIADLIAHGFWLPTAADPKLFHVAHEGVLWRRGIATNRRAIHPAIRRFVMERDGSACVQCGSTDALSLDHIRPYSKGGPDTADNLRVLCQSCNSSKGNRVDAS